MKKLLQEEHGGIGGLYFFIVNYAMAVILIIALRLSWTSQAVAMADNLAYIAAINTNISYYMANYPTQNQVHNPNILCQDGSTYSPLTDFNNMLAMSGFKRADGTNATSSDCNIIYNAVDNSVRIQFGEIDTILGIKIKPHEQQTVIEYY